MTEWRITDKQGNVEDNLFDVEVVLNANPFGDHATAFIQTRDGSEFDEYPRGTRVDFEVREGGTNNNFTTRLNAFVVERRESNQLGAEVMEVECYALDTLLRRNQLGTDISDQSVSSALEEIIKDWTPVTWNASKVDMDGSDPQVNRPFENEKIDNILRLFSRKSANQEFGVDDSLEFFFRPGESSKVSRGVNPREWSNYDLPERGKEAINEVRVYFDDGDRVVTVDDSEDKQSLQDSLGSSKPVTQSTEVMREKVQDRSEAIAVGKKILRDQSPLLTGTVTTFGLITADAGDAIDIRIPSRGIHDEFRIAQIEYRWGADETVLTVVEEPQDQQKEENVQDDMLVRMSDTLKRVEMRVSSANADLKESTRILETEIGCQINIGGNVDSVGYDVATFTNTGFRALRDAWINQNTITVSNVLIGTDDTKPSRTDTALGSLSETISAIVGVTSPNEVNLSDSTDPTTGDDIKEVGFEDSNGDLLFRATLNQAVTAPDNVLIDVIFKDNPNFSGVITETGQQYARDLLADNGPTHSQDLAFGDGSTNSPAVTQTSLDNELTDRALGDEIVLEADTQSEWEDAVKLSAASNSGDPIWLDSGKLKHAQTAFVADAQNNITFGGTTSGGEFTGSTAAALTNSFDSVNLSFSPDYDITSTNLAVAVRARDNSGSSQLQIECNNETETLSVSNSLEWQEVSMNTQLTAGDYSLTILLPDGSDDVDLDVFAIYDDRFYTVGNFDNSTGGTGDYLTDPDLYPSDTLAHLGRPAGTINLPDSTDEASVTSTWNDTTNNQAIVIESNTNSNTQTATSTFSSTTDLDVQLRLSTYGSRTDPTPTENFNAQTVDDVVVSSGIGGITAESTRAIQFQADIPPGTITGSTVRESGLEDSSDTLQTRSTFADFTVETGQIIAAREVLRFRMDPNTRPVNQQDFEPNIRATTSVASSNRTGTEYFLVRATDFRGEV